MNSVLLGYQFSCLLFKVAKNIIRGGRVIRVTAPAFPSYIFIDAQERWDYIRRVSDVLGFVRFGSTVAFVPEDDIAALKARADEEGVLADSGVGRFHPGQKVTITSGLFMGPAVYHRCISPGRAFVLVETMGRSAPLSISESELYPEVQKMPKHHRSRKMKTASSAYA